MGKIWEFFDTLSKYVYVADMDTHDLVYMNQMALKAFGVSSPEEVRKHKCHALLQNCSAPCTICNNDNLRPGTFLKWSYYHTGLQKFLYLIDTMIEEEGHRYRLEIAIDISEPKQANADSHYLSLEMLINEGLRVALQQPTPDATLNFLLEYLGKLLKGDRAYIFEKNETGGDNNTYEWVAAGVTPEKEDLQDLPPEVCASWYQKFSENKHIMIEDLEKIREDDPALYHVLHKQNISSLVVVPFYDNGKAFAFYGIDNPPAASLEYTSGILHIMGHFIVAALKRRNLVRQLQDMSLRDELTGLGNRHALHLFTEKNDHYASVGIVYCDITGLKAANDSKGHLFGDRLISNAGLCLQKAFDGYGLFRVGGDELLVICPDISHELLEEKVAMLRRLTKEYEVNLAIGYCWNDQNASAINIWMAKAESAMYQEKSAYYKAKGIEHR